jgi:ketosteroid isomerase-like protein
VLRKSRVPSTIPAKPVQLPGSGRSATTYSISGCAHSAEPNSPRSHAEAEDYVELDDERVLVLAHSEGRGKASGLEIGQTRHKGAVLFHIRDGKVTRFVAYWDRERAFADLGLKG